MPTKSERHRTRASRLPSLLARATLLVLWMPACAGEPPADACQAPAVLKDGACTFAASATACAAVGKVFADGACYDCPAGAPFDAATQACVGADGGAFDGVGVPDTSNSDTSSIDTSSSDTGSPDASPSDASGTGDAGTADGLGVHLDAGSTACVPNCQGKACGHDGCGGTCGSCSPLNGKPVCKAGQCVAATCTPSCTDSECGPDGCGGTCGSCKAGLLCVMHHCQAPEKPSLCTDNCGKAFTAQKCSCKPGCDKSTTEPCCEGYAQACTCKKTCAADSCGGDGCGGQCGPCQSGTVCVADKCVADPCVPDPCNGHGTCAGTGVCTCSAGFAGDKCDACAPGLVGYPACKPDPCAGQACNGKGTCDSKTGACVCSAGFAGAACHACATPSLTWPDCTPVACSDPGSDGKPCEDGDTCTQGETCASGTCSGGKKVCALAVNTADDKSDGACDSKHCSLREAIVAANANPDTTLVGFAGDYVIQLTGPLPKLTTAASFDHLGHAVTVDGGGKHRCFHATAYFGLKGLTVQSCGSAAVHYGGALLREGTGGGALSQVVFKNNKALYRGGAVWAGGALSIDGCTFSGNAVLGSTTADPKSSGLPAGGGALFVQAAGVTVVGSTFADNVAGGVPKATTPGQPDAIGYGGALCAEGDFDLQVATSTFHNNTAAGGGALALDAKVGVVNSTLANNKAHLQGGAVMVASRAVQLLHCTLAGNEAGQAFSALWNGAGPLTLVNTLIAAGKGSGPVCGGSGAIAASTKSLVQDGSCNASLKGAPQLGALADNGGPTMTMALTKGSPAVDAADGAGCGLTSVGGVDQRGTKRPKGAACDVGAFEL